MFLGASVYTKAGFVKTTSFLDVPVWLKQPWPACESSDEKEDGLYGREVADNPLCGEKGEQTPQSLHARAEAVEDSLIPWLSGCVGEKYPEGFSGICWAVCTHRGQMGNTTHKQDRAGVSYKKGAKGRCMSKEQVAGKLSHASVAVHTQWSAHRCTNV